MFRVLLSLAVLFWFSGIGQAQDRLIVFAPSSMTDVVQAVAKAYTRNTGISVVASIAGTSQLARQIEQGAPADIFISADQRWMDWAVNRKLVNGGSVTEIASNQLVVAVPSEVENWADVRGLLTGSPFSMGDPDAVPAGAYGKEALIAKGWWDDAKAQASYGENVRVSLSRLVLGEVSSAIVYQTDVALEPRVRTLMIFSKESHTPILYRVALVTGGNNGAVEFLKFMNKPEGQAVFKQFGFLPPDEVN